MENKELNKVENMKRVTLSDIYYKEDTGIIGFEEVIKLDDSISARTYEYAESFKSKMLGFYIEKVRIYTELGFEVSVEFGTTINLPKSE